VYIGTWSMDPKELHVFGKFNNANPIATCSRRHKIIPIVVLCIVELFPQD